MSEASIQIVCGKCDSVVRVPAARLAEGPKCPKCHGPLLDGKPIELATASFDKHLTRNDLPLVIDVWAPWCGPCRMMAPHFEEAAHLFAQRARFAKVNSDEENALSARFGVRGIPTLIVFRNGRELARQSGAMDGGALSRWLTSTLG
jgi:thioredoxin 2